MDIYCIVLWRLLHNITVVIANWYKIPNMYKITSSRKLPIEQILIKFKIQNLAFLK